MDRQHQLPGHVNVDQFNQMLMAPESFAAKPESLDRAVIYRSFSNRK